MRINWLTALLLMLASYRVTRLLIDDAIFDKPRDFLLGQLDQEGKLRYLLGCYWCLGLWVSAGLTLLIAPNFLSWLFLTLGSSTAVGFLASSTPDYDEVDDDV